MVVINEGFQLAAVLGEEGSCLGDTRGRGQGFRFTSPQACQHATSTLICLESKMLHQAAALAAAGLLPRTLILPLLLLLFLLLCSIFLYFFFNLPQHVEACTTWSLIFGGSSYPLPQKKTNCTFSFSPIFWGALFLSLERYLFFFFHL